MQNENAPSHGEEVGARCLLGGDNSAYTPERPLIQHRERKPLLSRRPDPDALASAIWASVNRWDIDRRSRGIRPADRRISKADADRELKRGLAALAKGGA